MPGIKLFCFPYAGGSAAVYNKWREYLDARIELIPVELAGRGYRIQDELYVDFPGLISDLFQTLRKTINGSPYALFGHSMGSRIAYDLAQMIRSNGLHPPMHIFFSGKGAPHIKRTDEKQYHLMEDEEFRKELIELGGTQAAFFESPELVKLFLPVLKNDFRLVELALHCGTIHPLDTDITVFAGEDEDLTPEQCEGWKMHTNGSFRLHYFTGGHFFLWDETATITGIINNSLQC